MKFPLGKGPTSEDNYLPRPLGYSLALFAAKYEVPLIAIVTAQNHHNESIAATFDDFFKREYTDISLSFREGPVGARHVFHVDKSKLVFYDADNLGKRNEPKNWKNALERLLLEVKEQ